MRRSHLLNLIMVGLLVLSQTTWAAGNRSPTAHPGVATARQAPVVATAMTSPVGYLAKVRFAVSRMFRSAVLTIGHFLNFGGSRSAQLVAAPTVAPATRDVVRVTAAPVVMAATDVQRTILAPERLHTPSSVDSTAGRVPQVGGFSATLPAMVTTPRPASVTSEALAPATANIPASVRQEPASAPATSVITIQSRLTTDDTPASEALQMSPSAAPVSPAASRSQAASARMATSGVISPMETPRTPAATGASPTASHDILNYKTIETSDTVPAVETSHPAAAPSVPMAVSSSTASAPLPASTAASAPVLTAALPASAPITAERAETTVVNRPAETAAHVTAAPSATSMTATTAPLPTIPRIESPIIAQATPVVETRTETRPTMQTLSPAPAPTPTSVRAELNCGDIAIVVANRTTCRCPVGEAGLGNILPLPEAQRAEPHAVAIENGRVRISPSLYLREALNCSSDRVPATTSSFELPQPRMRGTERDLLVVNVFGTPDGRLFGISVEGGDRRIIRGLAIWDVGISAATSTLTFKLFPESLQLNQGVRGIMVTKDNETGRTSIDITLIADDRTQVPHHCEISRDDTLTCTEPAIRGTTETAPAITDSIATAPTTTPATSPTR